METAFLETFLAVARRGSLAAAAQEQGISANAVAQRLRALEAELGATLIARTGRTVLPTEAGNAVLAHAEAFLSELHLLRSSISGQAIEGELRFGAIASVLTGLIPDVLDILTHKHDALRVFLEPGTSAQLYERTFSRALDAAAIIRPPFHLPKTLEFHSWRRDPLVLMVPADEKRTEVLQILTTRPLILYDRKQWGGQTAAAWLEAQQLELKVRFELDALDAIAILVGRGLGVAVLPDWTGPLPEGVNVQRLVLPPPALVREIGILSQRNGPRTHLLRVMIDAIAELLPHQ